MLDSLVQIAEIDEPLLDPGFALRRHVLRLLAAVGLKRPAVGPHQGPAEDVGINPLNGNPQPGAEPVEPESGGGEILSDFGQITSHQGPVGQPRFQKHHPESLGQAGGQYAVGSREILAEAEGSGCPDFEPAGQL